MGKESSLNRMLSVLAAFTEEKTSITREEVAQLTGGSRATSYRYLQNLCEAGLLSSASENTYVPGPRIMELDRLIRLHDPVLSAARGPMVEASERLGLNVMLCSYFGRRVVCSEILTPDGDSPSSYERGRTMPLLRGAMAKIIIAHLPHPRLKAIYAENAETLRAAGEAADWSGFRTAMNALKENGYAVTCGEVYEGVTGYAAPVFDANGKICGSIVFMLGAKRRTASDETRVISEIIELGRLISSRLAENARGM
ncbi:IclR family transcriptional regulator [Microvirga terricola]|uniref:IclR family transcriptional regulator n=1 Tax=Microvirga terricola TaxID=2719797 RepID=A0ABX0V7W4_9HYPH|nr:IclR family transcriptional regulator [Microvirga terricola]NIX75940.1 IclR family transcriptional regulator [Microvirga terricola]